MKQIAFISKRRIVAQGLEAVLEARPELRMKLLPLIPPVNARVDVMVHRPDILLVDVTGTLSREGLFSLCRRLKEDLPECKVVLLLSEDEEYYRNLMVQARTRNLADDFVFYDNSVDYLLAKLSALEPEEL